LRPKDRAFFNGHQAVLYFIGPQAENKKVRQDLFCCPSGQRAAQFCASKTPAVVKLDRVDDQRASS
jgi:hypothetical protein